MIGQTVWFMYMDHLCSGTVEEILHDEICGDTCKIRLSEIAGHPAGGTTEIRKDRCYATKQACEEAVRLESDKRVIDFKKEIPDIPALIRFMLEHNVAPGEYCDHDARRAAIERAREMGIAGMADHESNKALDQLSRYIVSELKSRDQISSNLYAEFVRLYAQKMHSDPSLSGDLTALYDHCQAYYNRHFSRENMSPSEAISGIYSCFMLYFVISDMVKEHDCQEELLKKVRSGNGKQMLSALSVINDNPGITHEKLAKALHMTTYALLQYIADYRNYSLFSTIAAGKEKAYFIEPNGKRLLEKTV